MRKHDKARARPLPARRRTGALLSFALLSLALPAAAPAAAQFPDDPPLPRREILALLERRGFEPIARPRLDGDAYLVDALSPRGVPVRLVVDAYDGVVIERIVLREETLDPDPFEAPPWARGPRAERLGADRLAPDGELFGDEPRRPAPRRAEPPRERAARVEPPASKPAPPPRAAHTPTPPPAPQLPAPAAEVPKPAETAAAPRGKVRIIEGVTPVLPKGDDPGPPARADDGSNRTETPSR